MILNKFDKSVSKKINQIEKFVKTNPHARLMRLDKPIGIYLTLLPALWAIAFASKSVLQIVWLFIVFTIGAIVVRGAGCILNDIADIDIDKKVKRTKSRPLASGEVSIKEAYKMLFLLLGVGFTLLFALPFSVMVIGLLSIFPIAAYPYFKRFTYYPQVALGFVFNIGIFMGWFTADLRPSIIPFVLYFAAILWTVGYDTIYGHQDKEDDLKVGVKSLSILLGKDTSSVVRKLYFASVVLISITGINAHMNAFFFAVMLIATYQLYWQTETLNIDDPKDCLDKFKSNQIFGLIVLIGILIGRI